MTNPIDHEGLHALSAVEMLGALRFKYLPLVEVVEHYLRRFEKRNPVPGRFFIVTPEHELEVGHGAADRLMEKSSARMSLMGLPIVFKDLISTARIRTTHGSCPLQSNVQTFSTDVPTRATGVRQSGARFRSLRMASAVSLSWSSARCSCPAMRTVICCSGRRVRTILRMLRSVASWR